MKVLETIREYRYELVAFLTGMSVMMLEIVGARLVAPYFGTSVYVWTAMIGVILGALAFGFWYGGRLADKYHHAQNMVVILSFAAALILVVAFVQGRVLEILGSVQMDLRLSALLAALLLFGPPSVLIGMISPHLAKVRLRSLSTTGRTVGRLEAAGAVGSILGTFLSGYFLLAYVGSLNITLALVVVLVLASFLIDVRLMRLPRALLVTAALLAIFFPLQQAEAILKDIDTSYSRYQVVRTDHDGRAVNYLIMDSYSIQSASYIDDYAEPVLPYARAFMQASRVLEPKGEVLVIGGGTHTFPTALAAALPDVSVTVAEIDPALDELARNYFGFEPSDRLQAAYYDGRQYLRITNHTYSTIYMDAYSSLTPPFHLATVEAVRLMERRLDQDGVVLANVVAATEGGGSRLLQGMYDTYSRVFDHVVAASAMPHVPAVERQNIILIASNDKQAVSRAIAALDSPQLPLTAGNNYFTDDFAPVERLSF